MAAVGSLALLLLTPIPAWAHAILLASQPVSGASTPGGKVELQFRFNSRIDRARSSLTLIQPDHTRIDLPIEHQSPPDIVRSSAELAPGAYVVRWQVLALDGHITRGDVPFTVIGR